MKNDPVQSSSSSEEPEEHLLDRFLSEHPAGERERLDAWLARQPETASDEALCERLRAALEDWRRAGSLLGRALPGAPPESETLAPGRTVGDFRLVRFVASGGMGQVWEAEQVSLGGRRVALKLILPGQMDERGCALFEREARAGGRLQHPGIVTVHGHGTSAGISWIAMEFVAAGRTLRDHIAELARNGALPKNHDRWAAALVANIAEAMQVAHEAGVIHRDIKPQNVLLSATGEPKISDFGLARILDEPSQSVAGQQVGTYLYMSPEQVAAHVGTIDHRADVFSLGVVLYELLTLRRPFQGDTTHQIAAQILSKDPADPRSLRSTLSRDLAVIAGKALEKERERRFQSMAEFAADLRRFLAHEPIHAKPPPLPARVVKWVRRNRVAALCLLLATVMASASGGLLWLQQKMRVSHALADAQSAARRGEVEACMGLLERARELGAAVPADLRVYEVDALIAAQEVDRARAKLEAWLAESEDLDDGRALLRLGMLDLWSDPERGERHIVAAQETELGESERALAQALLAPTVPECLRLLRHAVELEPSAYLPRMTLSMTLLISGRLEEATSRARSMQDVFPSDLRGSLVLRLISLLSAKEEQRHETLAWARGISKEAESLFASTELAGRILTFESLMGRPIDEERNELDLFRLFREGGAERALLSFMPRIPVLFRHLGHVAQGFSAFAEGKMDDAEQEFGLALECDPESSLASYLQASARMNRAAPDTDSRVAKTREAMKAFQVAARQPSLFPGVPDAASLWYWDGLHMLGTAGKIPPDVEMLVASRELARRMTLSRQEMWVYEFLLGRAVTARELDTVRLVSLAILRDHPTRETTPLEANAALLLDDWRGAVRMCDKLLEAELDEELIEKVEKLRAEALARARDWLESAG